MKRMLIFWEMRDSSMSFMPILPKPSQHTILGMLSAGFLDFKYFFIGKVLGKEGG